MATMIKHPANGHATGEWAREVRGAPSPWAGPSHARADAPAGGAARAPSRPSAPAAPAPCPSVAIDCLSEDLLGAIFEHLKERPRYLAAAAGVCARWRRRVLEDDTLLATWALEHNDQPDQGADGDHHLEAIGTPPQASALLSPVHTGRWTIGTTAEQRTPTQAVRATTTPAQATPNGAGIGAGGATAGGRSPAAAASPRTPSPCPAPRPALRPCEAVAHRLVPVGRYIGAIDLRSSQLDGGTLRAALCACPRLRVLRVTHECGVADSQLMSMPMHALNGGGGAGGVPAPTAAMQRAHRATAALGRPLVFQPRCGCAACPPSAMSDVHKLCPELRVVELVLQHVAFGSELRPLMASLGQCRRLHTLAIELRRPAFGASVRSACLWGEHARVGATELRALLEGTPAAQSLCSLSLNRCDPGKAGAMLLRRRAPRLRALALHSDVAGALGPRASVGGLAADSLSELSESGDFEGLEALALGQVHTEGAAGRGAHEALAALSAPALRSLCVECVGAPPPAEALAQLRDKCPKLRSLRVTYALRGAGGEREDTITLPRCQRQAVAALEEWEARVRGEAQAVAHLAE